MRNAYPFLLLLAAVTLAEGAAMHSAKAARLDAAARTAAAHAADDEARIRDADIAFFAARAAADPQGARDLQQLAALYLARARATGSPADLASAADAAETSLHHRTGHNDPARFVLANARMGEHRFIEALAQADTLVQETPTDATRRSLRAEILMELGRYDDARADFARLHQTVGNPSVAARQARWADITGHLNDARRRLESARAEAAATHALPAEQRAWYELRLAELALRQGRFADAEAGIDAALAAAPADHRALLLQARLAAARGDARTTVRLANAAMERAPSPELFALLDDAWTALGDTAQAASYRRALAVQVLAAPGAVHRPLAQHLLAAGEHLTELHARAEADLRERKDVYGWDLAAAARLAVGDTAGARSAADASMRQGTEDAGLAARAGRIALAVGDTATARVRLTRAFAIAPSWDLRETAAAHAALRSLR